MELRARAGGITRDRWYHQAVSAAILALWLVAPPEASPGPPAPASSTESRWGAPYLLFSPGGLTSRLAFPWGVSAGRMFPSKRRAGRLLTVGGFFEHVIGAWTGHELRAGSELRIGRARSTVFGYGLFRLGLELTLDRRVYRGTGIVATVGGGVQRLFGRHFLLGGELAANGLFYVDQHLPPEVWESWPLGGEIAARLLLGVKF